ncbi:MAG: ketoacyl-ACP synthase III [Nitrospiraceae bacterium]|nr:ketoacyl-ACP synthase III [Nitrospira sp.]MCA9456417.1 ketoacyl-ACP synthase III [Nitrospira sp.]MCB9773455.1 ketoacyl-ACP synthase III [Nitrospiraceae bacterium]
MNSLILGTGAYVPKRVLTNADLERMVETSDTWIIERTGIRERRVVDPGQACSDLAVEAAQRALIDADVAPSEIDLILVATCTGDSPLPSTACLIQHRLGANRAAACDISAACCGFIYALAIADAYVKNGMRHVLVIGSEVMSAITDWTDRNTCVLFGDGAGAVVVGQGTEGSGILSTHLHANGGLSDMIQVPGGGSREPASKEVLQEKRCFIKMKGNETFKIAVKSMEEATKEALEANKLAMDDVDLFIPHQANMRILNAVSQRLGLGREKLMINLDRFGNTSAASIPLALDQAVREGRIHKGSVVLLAAFGAGLTWASAVVRW